MTLPPPRNLRALSLCSLLLCLSPAGTVAAETPQELATRLAADGIEAFKAKDYRTALDKFRAARVAYSGDAILLYYMGRGSEELGNRDDAIAFFDAYLAAGADPSNVEQVKGKLKALRAARAAAAGQNPPPRGSVPEAEAAAASNAAPAAATSPPTGPSAAEGDSRLLPAAVAGGVAVAAALGMIAAAASHGSAITEARGEALKEGPPTPPYEDARGRADNAEIAFYALGVVAAASLGYGGYVWFVPSGETGETGETGDASAKTFEIGAVWAWTW